MPNLVLSAEMIAKASDLAGNLVIAALIAVVALWISRLAGRLTSNAVERLDNGDAKTLGSFAGSAVRYAILIVGVIAVLNRLGVQTASIIAVFGAATLAIGLALQGALSNIAAGVLIMVLRPYQVGDCIKIGDQWGWVKHIDLFTTTFATGDNAMVILPNSQVMGGQIINYDGYGERFLELKVGLDGGDDVGKALEVMRACAAAEPHALPGKDVYTALESLGDNGVNLIVRVWVKAGDYWDARFGLTRAVKDAFAANGLTMPYPHQVGLTRDEYLGKKAG